MPETTLPAKCQPEGMHLQDGFAVATAVGVTDRAGSLRAGLADSGEA